MHFMFAWLLLWYQNDTHLISKINIFTFCSAGTLQSLNYDTVTSLLEAEIWLCCCSLFLSNRGQSMVFKEIQQQALGSWVSVRLRLQKSMIQQTTRRSAKTGQSIIYWKHHWSLQQHLIHEWKRTPSFEKPDTGDWYAAKCTLHYHYFTAWSWLALRIMCTSWCALTAPILSFLHPPPSTQNSWVAFPAMECTRKGKIWPSWQYSSSVCCQRMLWGRLHGNRYCRTLVLPAAQPSRIGLFMV